MPLTRAIKSRIEEQNIRTRKNLEFNESIEDLLREITDPMRHDVGAQLQTKKLEYLSKIEPSHDAATITARIMQEFDDVWSDLPNRLSIVPGKNVLARLNERLQKDYGISITPNNIVSKYLKSEIPQEIEELLQNIEKFIRAPLP